ncbi:UNVERIFIED_CONTAM: hypothetical protein K2H54_007347 [Gekko kuhli]
MVLIGPPVTEEGRLLRGGAGRLSKSPASFSKVNSGAVVKRKGENRLQGRGQNGVEGAAVLEGGGRWPWRPPQGCCPLLTQLVAQEPELSLIYLNGILFG